MSFSVGIVGLPNVGKSTLFKALTKKQVEIAPRPFTTIHPNIGIVLVPDQRLLKVAEVIKPEKVTPTVIEFVDIAGLVKGAHKGEGLGNQFLAQIRNCDAILEVVRAFEDPKVENVLGEINPKKEIEIIKVELLMKDLETLENLISKLEKKNWKKIQKKIEFLKKIKEKVSQGKLIVKLNLTDEEKLEIRGHQFLTAKPILNILNVNEKYLGKHILNTDDKTKFQALKYEHLIMNLKEEEEVSELSEPERKELGVKLQLNNLILSCYNILNLITFFTVTGGKEARAWTMVKNSKAQKAGGVVHSDFEKRFIRAEVVPWQKLVEARSWTGAREKGWLQTIGKDYIVQDGDVIEFKI
ncbi:MAG: redox-regulated ATPase YchF [Candidatus Paceibacterales bacterium]